MEPITISSILTFLAPYMYYIVFLGLIYITLFLGFLIEDKKINYKVYFRSMIANYRASSLRIPFKAIILFIQYGVGLIILGLLTSAYYPANWFKKLIIWIFMSNPNIK